MFEPSTEIIRKGKAGKPTEFGKVVKLQEAEKWLPTKSFRFFAPPGVAYRWLARAFYKT